ncbi:right-handed parallel beta-helix repeat-containing protein [Bradyrhizobium prioriisuperbiae]|uniref:right-handed parallel beta-helix repeat-containing protein n=1 Tax=Bradyrhizobium prioriisuperbiae TaxID=2854389 RepID=UPI0028E52A9A|nr:right-handed parallel beta-helix repeat-containing protein [Bradyrhizobium prioritasuperba]
MKKLGLLALAIMGGILAITAYSAPAHAQATRTWVSGVGDDANPCSRTAPCKTFPGAISKTAAGGEINVLDPGGFGGVTITKAISIISESIEAGVLVSGTNAIIVNAGVNDKVLLSGLDIEGLGTGLNGVRILNAATVTIRKCSIRNFTQRGVDLEAANANSRVFIQDSQIINNTLGGFFLQGQAGVVNNAVIERTTFDLNGGAAVSVSGPGQVVLSANTLAFSVPSLLIAGGTTVISYGNNVFRSTGTPTQTIPLQ